MNGLIPMSKPQITQRLLSAANPHCLCGAGAALPQQSGIKRTPLQKVDFPAGYNTGGASGRHSHPGAETGYVLEGELELVIDGKPPLKLKQGQRPTAGGAARQKLLGSDKNPSGGRVVTYNRWPLYTYITDHKPGQATGQGVNNSGGLWYVLSPSGKVIKTKK